MSDFLDTLDDLDEVLDCFDNLTVSKLRDNKDQILEKLAGTLLSIQLVQSDTAS